ncbi:MAG: T9SS type A sorting domain-containing protein [Bacteroidia bacterium]
MKQQLQKKLYAFIVTAMLFSTSANAQIVYTDVNPDSTITCSGSSCTKLYNLDLNNDANNDFIITVLHNNPVPWWTSQASASPLNDDAVKATLGSFNHSIPLQFNDVIDSNVLLNQAWQTSGPCWMNYCDLSIPCSGGAQWNNLSDYYLGLRLLQSGQTYYGWVRLRVDVTGGHASVIIRDYAYNSIPNQAILAGQTTATGISPLSFGDGLRVRLFPNPANNLLTIALGSNNKKVDVTITDITGKIIYKTSAFEAQKIEVNTKDFAKGIYALQIQTADFMVTKKLVVEK